VWVLAQRAEDALEHPKLWLDCRLSRVGLSRFYC
jgi:hypothetical protein